MNNLKIRRMSAFEMKTAIDWADREGWNPGLHDEKCFYNADPEGFFVAVLGEKIVSMISAVKYDGNYGFIGFYIVAPPYRGKSYGIRVWNAAIDYLKNCVIGLDGVPAQLKNYEKSGFVHAHRNISLKGLSRHFDIEIPGVRQLLPSDFDIIRSYDKEFIPETRDKFLRCWISQDDSFVLAMLEDKKLKAFGKVRACREGFKIGPLFSDNQVDAEKIFMALQNRLPCGSSFTIDVPEPNKASLQMAENNGMEYFFETVRMYKSGMPKLDLAKIYGITTHELG